ncbi:thiol:disulfide interchange protein [Mycobacterium sp. ACS1612]|uniref:cytochrome c biogenesis protein DipZ n=1 Tax=Mycobacterium sp. ACS1612 TaxID=1834117 RepID=UPI0008002A45|nr:cytochrome c biogenesis protein DipZ [Mycobacterium sp. ACS1612]OBF36839.1 thiol:disulfide interchange protein [Mycobacterium sp. ACS1612]
MFTLILIGFLGGLITGISPCILPVLPVIFFSGTPSGGVKARPYRVIAGLVLSFSVVTLIGSALLSLLRLPQDAIRWVALAALVAIGVGLIFPKFEALLEKPFSRLPQKQFGSGSSGFGLGLALGVLYVPCAGPVLAAIVIAGATGTIGLPTVALTVSFAVGAGLPLLFFALAGRRVAERVAAFRERQREIRIVAGVVTILLAVALVFNLPAALQRTIPDYTAKLQETVGGDEQLREKLNLGGLINDQNEDLAKCTNGAAELESCGTAPDIKGITGWLNTPNGAAVDLKSLRGKVVIVDFWAYSCINCQRAIPHIVDWYRAYKDAGLEVIGVHTPEYAFEREPRNVASGARDLNITYPVALDTNYATWTNYRNRYWPAKYLIDAAGTVRHIKFGEGDYAQTETLIRQLLSDVRPDVTLPTPTEAADTTPPSGLTPETYLGVGKVVNYGGGQTYDEGEATFDYPAWLPDDTFALRGDWKLDYQGATADGSGAGIKLSYRARNVYLVVGGTGTVTVTRDGESRQIPVSGPPTLRQLVGDDEVHRATVEVQLSEGLQAFSFTYG